MFAGKQAPGVLALCLAAAIASWALLALVVERLALTGLTWPGGHLVVETSVALASLFGALVLSLVPSDEAEKRLQWVAGGFLVMGLGTLVFGILSTQLGASGGAGSTAWLVTRTAGCLLFAVGLASNTPPNLPPWPVSLSLGVLAIAAGLTPVMGGFELAPLPVSDPTSAAYGMTGLYWSLSVVPLTLAAAAVAGALRWTDVGGYGSWLVLAMVLLAGSQFHSLFWPSAFSPVASTVDLLRLGFAGLVAVGGVYELRRLAAERSALFAVERENSRRLSELAILRADFTAMVAHELGSPLAAIRAYASLLSAEELGQEERTHTGQAIERQTEALEALVDDVRAAAAVERDDFSVKVEPVTLDAVLLEAAAFARTLPGDHPLREEEEPQLKVLADAERVGQVIRNLLSNAAKFSPDDEPIELRARRSGARVRIEVADRGPGIHPEDMSRVFEKFGRGRDRSGRPVPGVGLGLYLSRRIVRAHGSELRVESVPGKGATFYFELEAAP